jgi:hypothetical protein
MANFEYFINLDERGEFNADVRNGKGKTVFEIPDIEALNEFIEDGFANHGRDLDGINEYLQTVGILPTGAKLVRGN